MISASKLAIATLGLLGLLVTSENVAVAQTRTTTNKQDCFTDDGYGRVRSCSQRFKKANPTWRTSASGVGFKRKPSKL